MAKSHTYASPNCLWCLVLQCPLGARPHIDFEQRITFVHKHSILLESTVLTSRSLSKKWRHALNAAEVVDRKEHAMRRSEAGEHS